MHVTQSSAASAKCCAIFRSQVLPRVPGVRLALTPPSVSSQTTGGEQFGTFSGTLRSDSGTSLPIRADFARTRKPATHRKP
jgi:hypothetical protein